MFVSVGQKNKARLLSHSHVSFQFPTQNLDCLLLSSVTQGPGNKLGVTAESHFCLGSGGNGAGGGV